MSPPRKPRLSQPDRLAEHMANGCPSVMEAARLMRLAVPDTEKLWKGVVRGLGAQAR